jgi:tetratricopeptide (TPR) repeat protein
MKILKAGSIVLLILSVLLSHKVWALKLKNFQRLPDYCKYVQLSPGYGSAKSEQYASKIGQCFIHMHHFCHGLQLRYEALEEFDNEMIRNSKLYYAIEEFDYVIDRAKADCVLLPEILIQKANTLFMRNDNAAAIAEIYRALKIKPDYVPGYVYVAKFYIKKKDFESARKVVDIGLKYNSSSEELKDLRAYLSRK